MARRPLVRRRREEHDRPEAWGTRPARGRRRRTCSASSASTSSMRSTVTQRCSTRYHGWRRAKQAAQYSPSRCGSYCGDTAARGGRGSGDEGARCDARLVSRSAREFCLSRGGGRARSLRGWFCGSCGRGGHGRARWSTVGVVARAADDPAPRRETWRQGFLLVRREEAKCQLQPQGGAPVRAPRVVTPRHCGRRGSKHTVARLVEED